MVTKSTNDVITYGYLIDEVLTKIKAMCQNISGSGKWANVPAQLKKGYTQSWAVPNGRANVTFTLNNAAFQEVAESTISTQLTEFLSSRGIATKTDKQVNAKGVFNFYSNIGSFLAARVVLVTSDLTTTKCVMYNSQSVTYPATNIADAANLTDAELTTAFTELCSKINNVQKGFIARYDVAYNCSSSSSSSCSSSSCSCSSSSSSSSLFIAYMRI